MITICYVCDNKDRLQQGTTVDTKQLSDTVPNDSNNSQCQKTRLHGENKDSVAQQHTAHVVLSSGPGAAVQNKQFTLKMDRELISQSRVYRNKKRIVFLEHHSAVKSSVIFS